jgi:protein-S-isoprenylcysteine O-methyltransferase Ste14
MDIAVYFVAAFLLLILAFIIFRVCVRRDYQRKGRLTWFSTSLEVLIFAVHANFSYIYIPAKWPALPLLPENPFHLAAGLTVSIIGLIGVVFGMTGLGFRRAFGQEVGELKQSGFYGLTRNPQILAYGFVVVGFAVLWPSWYSLGWVVLYAVIAQMMVLTEEEHLRKIGGEAYERYCERVPRYISFLGWK